jgi:cysteine desulfurase/selenocysteine lyase
MPPARFAAAPDTNREKGVCNADPTMINTLETSHTLPASIRDDFPALAQRVHGDRRLVFLDSAASSQRPWQVLEAIDQFERTSYANVHRGIHVLSERATDAYEAARTMVQKFIGARHDHEVIFTAGTTASINLVARSWGDANVATGDELLLSPMEHHSNLVPWFQLAERTGAVVRHIPLTDDGRLDLDQLPSVLTDRTKLVAVTAVSNTLGTVNPVAEIAAQAHAAGAVVLVDGAQSVPHAATDVQALGCDFLAFSGHKMCGPSGVGVLWGRESLLDAMPPFLGGGSMIKQVRLDGFSPIGLPAKFEAGTPPITPAVGLGAAVDYLQSIGMARIAAHEHALVELAYRRLSEIEGLTILGPAPAHRAGLVSFVLTQPHAHDIAQLVDGDGIAVRAGHHCTQPLHDLLGINASTRASFYLYNQPEDIEALAASLERVSAMFRPTGRKRRR